LYDLAKKQEACFWTSGEIDFAGDAKDWVQLTRNEQVYLENVLGFFACSDGIVADNIIGNFMSEVTLREASMFYSFQNAIEAVHGETYSLMITAVIPDEEKQLKLFNGINDMPFVQKKAKWAAAWMDPQTKEFSARLAAFAVVEGLLFSASFCSIFWLRTRGLCPAICHANELIARDEGLHMQFACALYAMLDRPLPARRSEGRDGMYDLIEDAIETEETFIDEAMPENLQGLSPKQVKLYVRWVADDLLGRLGYPKLYNLEECPIAFMTSIGVEGKSNFFEKRVSEYQRAGARDRNDPSADEFAMSEDF
jgi:ribonucleoside-diphosphate reductase beta chain